jgi:methionyl aminopeptidase
MNQTGAEPTRRMPGTIKLHDESGFAGMRKAGNLTAQCLDMLTPMVQPGVTTDAIDRAVFEFAMDHKALPATLNYHGYPRSCCTSINEVICHGIPDNKPLKEGDIVNIDVTLIVDGWHGDSSRMYGVGEIKPFAMRLITITYECLAKGLAAIKPGAKTGAIGAAIQKHAEAERCSVVRDFCGHGLGQLFHDEPNILHFGSPHDGVEMRPGMIFTVEPMINLGRPHVKISKKDGWTAKSADRSLSAQFEHSIGVTQTGCEIFTASPKGIFFPDKPNHPFM